jgi:hypothetical protein
VKDWIKSLDKTSFGQGLYSQSYQDELLAIIFRNIGTINPVPFCVEFGFDSSSLTDGVGCNTAKFILNDNWNSLLLDGDNDEPSINLHRHFLTPSNICEIFRSYGVPQEPEYISIDVDSTDLWLFRSLLKEYRAMLFSVEYNSHFPLDKAITFPDDPDQYWQGDRGYGASLKALAMVASENGYSLLWVVPFMDAFFIRTDLVDDGTPKLVFPFSKWSSCTSLQFHKPLKDRSRVDIFIDYEVYVRSGGDMQKSRQAARETCMTYLVGNGDLLTKLTGLRRLPARIRRKVCSWFPTQ